MERIKSYEKFNSHDENNNQYKRYFPLVSASESADWDSLIHFCDSRKCSFEVNCAQITQMAIRIDILTRFKKRFDSYTRIGFSHGISKHVRMHNFKCDMLNQVRMCEQYRIDIFHIEIKNESMRLRVFRILCNRSNRIWCENKKESFIMTVRVEIRFDSILASIFRVLLDSADNLS